MAHTRLLVEVAREYCAARGYGLMELSDGWLLRIKTRSFTHFIFGYDLGLNSSAAAQLANDKSATFDALQAADIPAIAHVLFHSPRMTPYVSPAGNWRRLIGLFDAWNQDVVLKPHMGTGGDQVSRARTIRELEEIAQSLLSSNRAITVSPFYDFAAEYRVIVLNGEARVIFRKERRFIVGDGVSTAGALAAEASAGSTSTDLGHGLDLAYVPAAGETILLEWRHNLGHGATPVSVEFGADNLIPVLSKAAVRELGLRFASVDIAAGAEAKVLEVNSGVMLDLYAQTSGENRGTATKIYEDALDRALEHAPASSA